MRNVWNDPFEKCPAKRNKCTCFWPTSHAPSRSENRFGKINVGAGANSWIIDLMVGSQIGQSHFISIINTYLFRMNPIPFARHLNTHVFLWGKLHRKSRTAIQMHRFKINRQNAKLQIHIHLDNPIITGGSVLLFFGLRLAHACMGSHTRDHLP